MTNHANHDPMFARLVDVIQPENLAHLGIEKAVPVFEMVNPADQRKWCRATQLWLEDGLIPANGCPTRDLLETGGCRRSPSCGKCLLLLPFDHPDWQPAFREQYIEGVGFMRRDEPTTAPTHRHPLPLEVLER